MLMATAKKSLKRQPLRRVAPCVRHVGGFFGVLPLYLHDAPCGYLEYIFIDIAGVLHEAADIQIAAGGVL